MTDTNTLAPTDAEIFALEVAHTKRHETRDCTGYFSEFDIVAFTLSAIAKWGATAPASQPFAYEFSRSNGDGTHSEHIERGRLQEVAPGRWEHSGLPRGALADKPIKALYTTPQTQPAAVPASGPVGFDHKTAANFLNGKTVTNEEVRQFVAHSRWAHDDRDGLRNTIADLRREIARRDAEIALLKTSLLDAEARLPLTDDEAFKAYTTATGQKLLKQGPDRQLFLQAFRLAETVHGIAAQEGDAA